MTKRNVVVLVCTLLVVGAVVLVVPYRVWLYGGPGRLQDNGVLSHPRFQLWLPPIVLGQEPHHSFTFTGVPSDEMSLMLYVEGSSLDDFDTLKTFQMQITARLFEEATALTPRRVVCEATGSPSARAQKSQWVVMASGVDAAFWHGQCLRMPMSSRRRYTLDLEITPTGASLPAKVLVPTLEGGGIELP